MNDGVIKPPVVGQAVDHESSSEGLSNVEGRVKIRINADVRSSTFGQRSDNEITMLAPVNWNNRTLS